MIVQPAPPGGPAEARGAGSNKKATIHDMK